MASKLSAVALLSSGLDSSVAVAMAMKQGYELKLALTFDYGQKAAPKELEHAGQLARYWNIPHHTLELSFFSSKAGSSLLRTSETRALPHLSLADLDDLHASRKSAKSVWVPNRNGVFIEIAACFAEQLDASYLIVGFNREEAATFPDNSKAYRESLNQALAFSTSNQVKVISPTESLDKTEIVRHALELQLPLELFWSCYQTGALMCGVCESCMRLKRAFKKNEVPFHDYFTNPSL
ncbi:7-cyano-7-deazaguanine synthase QueC [bacterium]|nr:7-cyano-7-deazaguanine synthase QueC [bacterium]